ncbi:MAG: retropepsin-like aspartic protease [Candidatus Sulfobium sp.]|jgi:predicted aspartyl protease
MNIFRYFFTAFVILIICGACPLYNGRAEASADGAVVRSDRVPVYSGMSADSRLLKYLGKGEQVVVDVEIEGPEGAWCGVTEEGQTSVTGYVQCETLDRPQKKESWQYVGSTGPRRPYGGEDSRQTKVAISGNHVLVPATLEYKGRTVYVRLVLDTGATVTMINTDIADQLGIDPAETVRGEGQVVGGAVLQAAFARLGYVSVGPHTKRDMIVSIMEEKGLRERRDGLLGMDFLRGLKYYVDFSDRVINWGP